MTDRVDYHGPPRVPQDVIDAALADEDVLHDLEVARDEILRGIPGTPFRQILDEERARRANRKQSA